MFVFSEIHDYQDEPAVKQILVFHSQESKERFDGTFKELVDLNGKHIASDTGIGAIYKLRAVKNGNDKWDSVIRCGVTGKLLSQRLDLSGQWGPALSRAILDLSSMIKLSFDDAHAVARSQIESETSQTNN